MAEGSRRHQKKGRKPEALDICLLVIGGVAVWFTLTDLLYQFLAWRVAFSLGFFLSFFLAMFLASYRFALSGAVYWTGFILVFVGTGAVYYFSH